MALFLLVGGLASVGRSSGPYHATVDESFGAEARVLIDQSNSVGAELRRDVACMILPKVGAVAALFEGLRVGRIGNLARQRLFCFGAEVGRNRDDASDVRHAVGVDVAGVGVGGLGRCGACLLSEECGGREQKGRGEKLHR